MRVLAAGEGEAGVTAACAGRDGVLDDLPIRRHGADAERDGGGRGQRDAVSSTRAIR